jgi:nucleoside-diphosphate-sugar epimerase
VFSKLQDDLDHILLSLTEFKERLSNKTFFVTGGTGFFGIWIQMTFIHLNEAWSLNSKMIVLTRNEKKFLEHYPWIANANISFIEGDVTSFIFPKDPIDFIIHAATEASVKLNLEEPLVMYDTIVNGTKRLLDLAVYKRVHSFLLISSGAVYGEQPAEIEKVSEKYNGAPIPSGRSSMYGEAKRMAETMCSAYYNTHKTPVKIARCFAFVGPYIPLDGRFAVGNFIGNKLKNEEIIIQGDGSPIRSYLYMSDLVIWLWKILMIAPSNEPYNVGSDESISIKDLSSRVKSIEDLFKSELLDSEEKIKTPNRYVPSILKAQTDLGLKVKISLNEGLMRTYNFYKSN